ncbi:hypothetical protein OUZ56_016574 [Daphnia magna]|uniref:Uncharacterized protein n=1 Tax=Daphnia magna TaxID=35525 RepID=A0ABR0AR15_9CRUS|nr:hypothetical protein OUZ56_016574 [Daphnia magna]
MPKPAESATGRSGRTAPHRVPLDRAQSRDRTCRKIFAIRRTVQLVEAHHHFSSFKNRLRPNGVSDHGGTFTIGTSSTSRIQ